MGAAFLTHEEIHYVWTEDPSMGSFISFEGKVRNHSSNGNVVAIEYTAYEDLALSNLKNIIQDTEAMYQVRVDVVHRLGVVPVGQTALLVAVISPHRKEGFLAVQKVVDRIKEEVPIWKKEILEDGRGVWI
ncbi:molybdenum cofactor biosynthesis protein MoaE [Coprothermobacter platensis]|uniref:molybdenum cofactor biosynthesis protein MoaE n=1 Tax=Coprothermobacter platensis TaxID=108819 RepID=UPI000361927E|nr:molybdenum cofactor biosynthesis protein MoaE [Coprothermobacter platensis]